MCSEIPVAIFKHTESLEHSRKVTQHVADIEDVL
jgi:hypothetical protein